MTTREVSFGYFPVPFKSMTSEASLFVAQICQRWYDGCNMFESCRVERHPLTFQRPVIFCLQINGPGVTLISDKWGRFSYVVGLLFCLICGSALIKKVMVIDWIKILFGFFMIFVTIIPYSIMFRNIYNLIL